MNTRFHLLAAFSLFSSISLAQPGIISCSSQYNPDNSVSIFAECQATGDYTVKLIFTTLNGYDASPMLFRNMALVTVQHGKREILKLRQVKSSGSYLFQYRYQYLPGRALSKYPDSSFTYLLPVTPGNNLRISGVSSLYEILKQKAPYEYHGMGFTYKFGDTICASRGGMVYNCNGSVREGEKLTDTYRSNRNKIEIEHKDGTLGSYSILAPVKLLVQPGEEVHAGQPLAIFDKESEKYGVLLATYFLDQGKYLSVSENSDGSTPTYFVYIPLHFYTEQHEAPGELVVNKIYTATHPREVVAAEMSKREKKKLGFN